MWATLNHWSTTLSCLWIWLTTLLLLKTVAIPSNICNNGLQPYLEKKREKIQSILWQYYQLAFERRPEFMGWSQTEPKTKTTYTDYNHFFYGDEAQQRIDQYDALEAAGKKNAISRFPQKMQMHFTSWCITRL